MTPHVNSILILMKSSNFVVELRWLVGQQRRVDRPNLFETK
ncbi:hypothetical protein GXM_10328 [Nostoc sphaeroides CCNUC1]|uniref:Uncharacterized protein n=1 Tax=Nostoc sphaeroides CCNUC1 TaxID=2653204 RepID=A0A5P8WI73_9NOSO|nr:hypothetical protein GXM_10328 [Nostoc sphaeroides CCNUC1]